MKAPNYRNNKVLRDLGNYSEWPKVAGAVIKADVCAWRAKMRSLSIHLAKRLTRLSGLVPSGTLVARVGSCVLLLPTMPLMSAARVCKCRGSCLWAKSDRLA